VDSGIATWVYNGLLTGVYREASTPSPTKPWDCSENGAARNAGGAGPVIGLCGGAGKR
jgi:hypothetical protein